ncbi:hypothetical protein [Furfurilactobacillus entadae]|uniref:hypothetical protein n=1 Tax=Furfurilactobacillus entadae TaxID=2922307 RepID=UPI0035EEB2ED
MRVIVRTQGYEEVKTLDGQAVIVKPDGMQPDNLVDAGFKPLSHADTSRLCQFSRINTYEEQVRNNGKAMKVMDRSEKELIIVSRIASEKIRVQMDKDITFDELGVALKQLSYHAVLQYAKHSGHTIQWSHNALMAMLDTSLTEMEIPDDEL